MKKRPFYVVDVFAESKYTGNQLAVFRHAESYSVHEMQQLAREMNYSETTFILSDEMRDGGYAVRIFTPETELPFAGHPTLGTAYIIQQEIVKERIDEIALNLQIGKIPVTFNYVEKRPELLWMKQIRPIFGKTFTPDLISKILRLDETDINNQFPIQEVSTGVPCIIVPLKTLDAVKRASIDRDRYFKLVNELTVKSILIFSMETYGKENDLNVRFFADYYGVPEDPATGSGNGCLAGYLIKHNFLGRDQINVRVEQGYEINRPSLLFLSASKKEGGIDISVGGRVVMIAEGNLI
jgi:trans-2,3-dihydro-3-hydroxyanthranilate isomerase